MRRAPFAIISLVLLSACSESGGSRSALIQKCVASSGEDDRASCTCMADIYEKRLSPSQLKLFLEVMSKDPKLAFTPDNPFATMSDQDKAPFMAAFYEANMSCDI